jgi:uncharacterized membrane protein
MSTLKKISLVVLIIGYIGAGINHFRIPEFYIGIIPKYLPYPEILNILAGIFEILFALMLTYKPTRKIAAWGIVLMLIAFLPVHIDMLSGHTMLNGKPVLPVWAWVRVFFQPVLIAWAWWYTFEEKKSIDHSR